jgi:hypothetical protein
MNKYYRITLKGGGVTHINSVLVSGWVQFSLLRMNKDALYIVERKCIVQYVTVRRKTWLALGVMIDKEGPLS